MQSIFHASWIKVDHDGVTVQKIELPEKSGLIAISGSGKASLKTWSIRKY
jgi:N-acetylglucosamine kinase-like BadF-type ATPase